ncbi:hypothetical protein DL93DRAFT_2174322 [Clavulina sp. PMI_390]|nr:hypothetical protein DL93DRAFT_2174322 [Clavulina sp. PMI_390]
MSIPKLNSSNYALWRPLIDIELDKGGKSYWFDVVEPTSEAKEKQFWHTACLDASPRRFGFVLWLWELCWASCLQAYSIKDFDNEIWLFPIVV